MNASDPGRRRRRGLRGLEISEERLGAIAIGAAGGAFSFRPFGFLGGATLGAVVGSATHSLTALRWRTLGPIAVAGRVWPIGLAAGVLFGWQHEGIAGALLLGFMVGILGAIFGAGLFLIRWVFDRLAPSGPRVPWDEAPLFRPMDEP